jgi:hypothetical protein
MAKDVSIHIDDVEFSNLFRGIEKYTNDVQKGIKKAVEKTSINIQKNAVDEIKRSGVGGAQESYKYDARLARSIKIKRHKQGFGAEIFTNVFYAIFREKGTVAHKIRPKRKQFLAFKVPFAGSLATGRITKSLKIFAKEVNHPGTKAAPFMEPAFLKEEGKFISTIKSMIRKVK